MGLKRICILSIVLSGCGYWPFIDHLYVKDFTPHIYNDTIKVALGNNDALQINATAWLPDKRRSEKLNSLWIVVDLTMTEDALDKKLQIKLDECDFLLFHDIIEYRGRVVSNYVKNDMVFDSTGTFEVHFKDINVNKGLLQKHIFKIGFSKIFDGEGKQLKVNLAQFKKE